MPRPEAFKRSSTVTGAWWREADRTKTENATTAFAVWPNGSTRWWHLRHTSSRSRRRPCRTSPAVAAFHASSRSAMNSRSRSTFGWPPDRVTRSARIFEAPPAMLASRKRRRPTSFAHAESLGLLSRQSRSRRISHRLARASPALAVASVTPLTSSEFASFWCWCRCVRRADDTVDRTNLRKRDRNE